MKLRRFSRERVRPCAPVRLRVARALAGGLVRQRATRAGRHATTGLAALALCIAAAGCGSAGHSSSNPSQPEVNNTFSNKAAFEQDIATDFENQARQQGVDASVTKIDCIKTDPNKAQCIVDATDSMDGPSHWLITVECQSVDSTGGHDCIVQSEVK